MTKSFRKFAFGLAVFAYAAVLFHVGHADFSHINGNSHDCALCQTISTADANPHVSRLTFVAITTAVLMPTVEFHQKPVAFFLSSRAPPSL